jgi:hypothetical protein
VKVPHVIDRFVERNVQDLASANRIIDGDSHKKRGLAEAMPGNDNPDITRADSAMNRMFK